MPICKKCETQFPHRVVINGKRKVISNRKYCLNCSPWGQHNTKKLNFINQEVEKDSTGIRTKCNLCNREYTYKRGLGHTRSECNSCKTNKMRFKRKEQAIEYKGGKCQRCGYNKSKRALIFHHRNPNEKEFAPGGNHCISWERYKMELDKCDLICANCHAEIHDIMDKNET